MKVKQITREVRERGQLADRTWPAQRRTTYVPGRICVYAGCRFQLSRYNPNPTCWQHTKPKIVTRTPRNGATL
jgi:hypothetical protein